MKLTLQTTSLHCFHDQILLDDILLELLVKTKNVRKTFKVFDKERVCTPNHDAVSAFLIRLTNDIDLFVKDSDVGIHVAGVLKRRSDRLQGVNQLATSRKNYLQMIGESARIRRLSLSIMISHSRKIRQEG